MGGFLTTLLGNFWELGLTKLGKVIGRIFSTFYWELIFGKFQQKGFSGKVGGLDWKGLNPFLNLFYQIGLTRSYYLIFSWGGGIKNLLKKVFGGNWEGWATFVEKTLF